MIDPPPRYVPEEVRCNDSLEIEREHTKQKEIEYTELTKQEHERTKQKEIELEIKRMEFEITNVKMNLGFLK